jgi:hypothetical protein
MLPSLTEDDLAILREGSTYVPEDVVAYRSSRLGGQIVLHRIVEVEGERFVLKGDNNPWIDSDRPTRQDIIGKLWIRVPGGGTALGWLRTPRNAAIVAGSAGLLMAGGLVGRRRRRRNRRKASAEGAPRATARGKPGVQAIANIAAVILAVILLAFGGLGARAFTQPATQQVATDVQFRQAGTFGYSAKVERGAVYPDGNASAGDPVFLRLADSAELRFDYAMSSEAPHSVSGSVYLAATLADDMGWKRAVLVTPPVRFTGDAASATAVLDLTELGALMQRVQKATGVMPGYSLILEAAVETSGTVAGRSVETSFSPQLEFEVDELVLRVRPPDDPEMGIEEVLERSAEDSVRVQLSTPSRVQLGPLDLEVERARVIAVIGAAATFLALLVTGLLLLLGRRRDEASRIKARYGLRMIEVAPGGGRPGGAVVELDSIESLVRLAESYERMILHEVTGGAHSYLVEGDVSMYRYSAKGSSVGSAPALRSPTEQQHRNGHDEH